MNRPQPKDNVIVYSGGRAIHAHDGRTRLTMARTICGKELMRDSLSHHWIPYYMVSADLAFCQRCFS
jgi:hypothetical protein